MKTAVITGASSGVGLALTRALLEDGWSVTGLARDSEKLATARRDMGAGSARFTPVSCDVRNAAQVEGAFETIGRRDGGIDLLVNNAAVFRMAPFSTFSAAEIGDMIDTNLKGTIYCTLGALRWLRDGSARVVNVGSVSGTHGIKHQAVYSASKFGVDGFGDALNQELLERGISLTTVAPGGIDTPLWDPATNPYPGDVGRLLQPMDIVDMIRYIAALPPHVVLKKVILFPSNEWH